MEPNVAVVGAEAVGTSYPRVVGIEDAGEKGRGVHRKEGIAGDDGQLNIMPGSLGHLILLHQRNQ